MDSLVLQLTLYNMNTQTCYFYQTRQTSDCALWIKKYDSLCYACHLNDVNMMLEWRSLTLYVRQSLSQHVDNIIYNAMIF